jgi:hypothetical protein
MEEYKIVDLGYQAFRLSDFPVKNGKCPSVFCPTTFPSHAMVYLLLFTASLLHCFLTFYILHHNRGL